MSDAYDDDVRAIEDRCGCGALLAAYSVNVVLADTGELVTKFCRRCAGDLVAAPCVAPAPGATHGGRADVSACSADRGAEERRGIFHNNHYATQGGRRTVGSDRLFRLPPSPPSSSTP